jgi:hypothetical protein
MPDCHNFRKDIGAKVRTSSNPEVSAHDAGSSGVREITVGQLAARSGVTVSAAWCHDLDDRISQLQDLRTA